MELIAPNEIGSSNLTSLYTLSRELDSSDSHSAMVRTSGYLPLLGGKSAPSILFRISPFCFDVENRHLSMLTGVDIVKSLLYREWNPTDNVYVSCTWPVVVQPVILDRSVRLSTIHIVFISFPVQNVSVHLRATCGA